MAEYATFEYGSGQTYGPDEDLEVTSIELITPRFVKFNFNTNVVINEAYFEPTNYFTYFYRTSETDSVATRVLTPYEFNQETEAVTTSQALVVFQKLSLGTQYTFYASNINGANGSFLIQSEGHTTTVRRTKTNSMLRGIPPHFSTYNYDSRIASMITAIGRSDDQIGGSQKDLI